MSFTKNNLVVKAFATSYKSEIYEGITLSFILLIIIPATLSNLNYIFILLELLGGLFFFPIIMAALRCQKDGSSIVLPEINLILRKSWKVFIVNLIYFTLIFFGLIFFLIPGLIVKKRYIYAGLICEKEMVGPLEAMRKSKELSMKNGWKVFCSEVFLIIINIIISLIANNIGGSIAVLIYLSQSWLVYVVINSLYFYGYEEAKEFN
tara:strand:- start:248 stop:868 length:621 start_codon:yes stop_codon:yes gene_type:complete